MITAHKFSHTCINFEDVLQTADISEMIKVVLKQAKEPEAIKRVDLANAHTYAQDEGSPMYFGMFVEWFAQEFLNYYGHVWNLGQVQMMDHEGNTTEDYGIDGMAKTRVDEINRRSKKSKARLSQNPYVQPVAGSPVYVQVKGTANRTKMHQANDGSRISNFMNNATTSAIKSGQAYTARYVLFTTGAGIHHTLDKMSNGFMECITIKEIDKLFKNDYMFLNELRGRVGLAFIDPPTVIDPEAQRNKSRLNLSE